MADELIPELQALVSEADVQVRDLSKREIDVRLVPWDTAINTVQGPEMFRAGAFDGIEPGAVLLMGMNHEAHLGLDQASRPTLTRRPSGKAIRLWSAPDGGYATMRVAKTQAGDEILELANEGIVKGISIEFTEIPGGTSVETISGRRTRVHNRVNLTGASTTYKPAYREAEVISVRTDEKGPEPMAEQEAPTPAAPILDLSPVTAQITEMRTSFDDRFAAMEERNRAQFGIPSAPQEKDAPSIGSWASTVLKMLSGDRIPDAQMRELQDLVTEENIGVVPPTYSNILIGKINKRRPFMETTTHISTPDSGLNLIVPRIVTRPTVAQQMEEKDVLQSDKTAIDTVTFEAVTKGGTGDISLQLLKRSSPSFLELYLNLLGEAYAIESEVEAVEALLGSGSGSNIVNDGGSFDPSDPTGLGDAWISGYGAMFSAPDTIWLSSAAVGAFIDAKASGTNAPLWSNLRADITAAGGLGGSISGLRPVHVPALNSTGTDVLIGPSEGFAWAEDGTYTLQVDVPSKAGRDVALVGILWFAPLYPSAFTSFALSGS